MLLGLLTLAAAARWFPRFEVPRAAGFRDVAPESGIDFRMTFLPNEQGEFFKTNLYDHGSGVAVADYDGDDDVLFLNQLGANALYRNRGDGTFENVTAQAPELALADRICVAAVGAVVKLFIGRRVMARQVHANGGYLSQSSKTLHFGLGEDERIDRAQIQWPSGTLQSIESPAANRLHEITEP